jgi:predicted dehydrogenase
MSTHNPASPIVRVGILGSSWWADAMYLPALAQHPVGHVTAIAGRNAAELAQRWGIPHVFGKLRRTAG